MRIPLFLLMISLAGSVAGCYHPLGYVHSAMEKDRALPKAAKVAVIGEYDHLLDSRFLSGAVTTELLDLNYEVIEQTHVGFVLSEQAAGVPKPEKRGTIKTLQQSIPLDTEVAPIGLRMLDRQSIQKLGQSLGVDALVILHITPAEEPAMNNMIGRVALRWVDPQTAKGAFSLTIINPQESKVSDADIVRTIREAIRAAAEGREVTTPKRDRSVNDIWEGGSY
jgi:hypothetical protein